MEIQICSNKGAGWNALIFSMENTWGKEIQLCLNKVPRVMYGPTPGTYTFI